MSDTLPTRQTPRIQVSLDDITHVFVLARPRLRWFPYPQHPLVFSCSVNGIWPAIRWGQIPPLERSYIQGKSWVLDAVAAVMLNSINEGGGRFTVSLDGAFRATDGMPICKFEVGA